MSKGITTCNTENCDGKVLARGMCPLHYGRWRRNRAGVQPCAVEGCEDPRAGREWCNKHYLRWRKYGEAQYKVDERKATNIVDLPSGDRVCTNCQEPKPLSEYHKDKNGLRGHRGICKPCRSAHMVDYYQDNRGRIVARENAYRAANIELSRERDRARYQRDKAKRIELATIHSQNRRARILGRDMDKGISVTRLRRLYGDTCPYCSNPMDFTPGVKGNYNPSRASIEHVTPISKGGTHTWDNVILACLSCNISRGNKDIAISPAWTKGDNAGSQV